MTSWHETSAPERGWTGFVLLACGLPALFFALLFGLDALLRLIAGWFV